MKSTGWIVMVNFCTADLAIGSLGTLAAQVAALEGARVLVVDNDSGDGSVERLVSAIEQNGWSSRVRLLDSGRNGGFAYGNNLGILAALNDAMPPDYVMLLNPDSLVRPGAVQALIDFMDTHPNAGIGGSRLENAEGGIECSAHIFPSPLGELEGSSRLGLLSRLLQRYVVTPPLRDEAHVCDWVSGASMIIRRKVFEDIGLMDGGFFLYFEEVDFCRRAKSAGWECWYVPESRVMHLEGAATGIRNAARRRPSYWYASRRRYIAKHHGIGGLVLADLLWSLGRLSYMLRRLLRLGAQGEDRDPKWFMFDLLWGDLRALFNGEAWKIPRVRSSP